MRRDLPVDMGGKRNRGNRQDSIGTITGRVSIEERPNVVEGCSRLGDIEVDLMVGKAHKSALPVFTDRTTLLTKLKKVTSRKAVPDGHSYYQSA